MPQRDIATPDKAFILAAGLGTRMRPLTDSIPKPLAQVGGRTLLSRTIHRLQQTGVKKIVINTHHLAQQITDHLKDWPGPEIVLVNEPVLLDTAGGIKNALPHFGGEPFFVLSGDGLWTDANTAPALPTLAAKWDPATMDILILLQPISNMKLTHGVGDYDILPDGRATRSHGQKGTHMFTSMRINHPKIFDGVPDGASSYLPLLDKAEKAGRLFAIEHKGDWHHISTPADLQAVNEAFAGKNGAA
ncbi:MAG TPA: nucleotidyltransferase family protein [Alphaproteobacteria bacterium]|nr:nucleotidyltransferase family protein [Micavibrio sp.]MBK9562494.1 nucleotidyltransferase family protein [Micavibrio sp.]HQX27164.1 nucleotidyltransferase family protein [Alphaproteobacteria bacterium]